MSTTPLPVVGFLGAPGSGRKSLVRSLLHQQGSPRPPPQQPEASDDPVWRIHTKYYSADVALRCVQAPGQSGLQPPCEFEAVVLVFDATDPASFGAVRAWADANAASTEGAGVRLAVATHADRLAHCTTVPQINSSSSSSSSPSLDTSSLQRPQWLSDAMDWCAGECYEYVECSTTDGALDRQLRLEGDVQGITRITQALQAHVWPGLVMVEQQGRGRGQVHSQPGSEVAGASGRDSDSAAQQSSQGSNGKPEPLVPHKPDAPSGQGASSTSCDVQQQQQQQQQEQQPERSQATQSRQAASHGADKVDDSDALERLMEQMAAAKQQCHQLPDDQRRAQAAALAMKFASMLGSDSEGEGGYDTD